MTLIDPDSIDWQGFLATSWQREPRLFKQGVPGFRSPLSADELAGLALEPDVESRIVGFDNDRWELRQGPFKEADFNRSDAWTLLVQGVDALVPEVAALRRWVSFLPGWRFDDIMVSYATDGGGVGPHFDRYDVFLVQGEGQRLWRLGDWCDEYTPRLEHNELNLLRSFTTSAEYLLEPGDILYVPPGLAHWGIAVGESMTYSIGFRAPLMNDLVARLADSTLESLSSDLLLEDQDSLTVHDRSGELTRAQIDNANAAARNAIEQLDSGSWFAELLTDKSELDADGSVVLPGYVCLHPQARIVWIDRGDYIELHCAGDRCHLDWACLESVESLCAGSAVHYPSHVPEATTLFEFLCEQGALINTDV